MERYKSGFTYRVFARNPDEASAKAWARRPKARALKIQYLYRGWWECTVLLEVS